MITSIISGLLLATILGLVRISYKNPHLYRKIYPYFIFLFTTIGSFFVGLTVGKSSVVNILGFGEFVLGSIIYDLIFFICIFVFIPILVFPLIAMVANDLRAGSGDIETRN